MVFYQVFAQFYPVQFGGVKFHGYIFQCTGASLPPPYKNSFGNFHTVHKFFTSLAKAKKYGARLRAQYAVTPNYPPTYMRWLRTQYNHCFFNQPVASNGQFMLF